MTSRLACLSVISLCVACDHTYIMEDAVIRDTQRIPLKHRSKVAVPAVREDGAAVAIRADTLLPNTTGSPGTFGSVDAHRSYVMARRGRPLVAVGILLDVIGVGLVAPGASIFDWNDELKGIASAQLIAFGIGHLIPGIILTAVGATRSPEMVEGVPLLVPSSAPAPVP